MTCRAPLSYSLHGRGHRPSRGSPRTGTRTDSRGVPAVVGGDAPFTVGSSSTDAVAAPGAWVSSAGPMAPPDAMALGPTTSRSMGQGRATHPQETPMTEHGAPYDHMGSKYDEDARTATLKRAESYTFFRMVGALAGQRVLDLAYGFGFYTRLFTQRGAGGRRRSLVRDDPPGAAARACRAVRHDVSGRRRGDPPPARRLRAGHRRLSAQLCGDQSADAGHVPERLCQPCRGRTLRGLHGQPGLHAQQTQQHAVWGHHAAPDPRWGGVPVRHGVCHRPADALPAPQWSQATHEWAVTTVGFQTYAWYPSEVAPEDVVRYGEAYWRAFYDNGLVIGLVGQKCGGRVRQGAGQAQGPAPVVVRASPAVPRAASDSRQRPRRSGWRQQGSVGVWYAWAHATRRGCEERGQREDRNENSADVAWLDGAERPSSAPCSTGWACGGTLAAPIMIAAPRTRLRCQDNIQRARDPQEVHG